MTYGTLCTEKLILGIEPVFPKLNWAFFFFLICNLFLKIPTLQQNDIDSVSKYVLVSLNLNSRGNQLL